MTSHHSWSLRHWVMWLCSDGHDAPETAGFKKNSDPRPGGGGCSAAYLSLEGHQLHVQLTEEGVGGGGAAGHGHHVLLCQVHAFGGSAARALVVSMLQGLVLAPTQCHL